MLRGATQGSKGRGPFPFVLPAAREEDRGRCRPCSGAVFRSPAAGASSRWPHSLCRSMRTYCCAVSAEITAAARRLGGRSVFIIVWAKGACQCKAEEKVTIFPGFFGKFRSLCPYFLASFGLTMLRQSRSPHFRPWIRTSAVAILLAKGILLASHRQAI